MKFAFALLSVLIVNNLASFTEIANTLLSERVVDGEVDYQGIKNNPSRINELYQLIGEMSLDGASEAEKKAFYINAYNIATIHQIIEHYPVSSPNDIKGFFDQKKHTIAGEQLTLNELEKTKLLAPYQDPRIHFVLVCAAVSCPPLADFAYQAENLDEQLDQKTRQALNSDDFIRVMPDQKKVELSQIFEWYQSDFTNQAESLIAYVNQYRDHKIPTDHQVGHYEYNWNLNDQ